MSDVPLHLSAGFVEVDCGMQSNAYAKLDEWGAITSAIDLDLEWCTFTDVFGGEHKRRTRDIEGVTRITPEVARQMAKTGAFEDMEDGIL